MDLAPKVSNALISYRSGKYSSIRAATRAFAVSESILRYYLSSSVSRAISYESEQYLSPAEEKTLIK